MRLLRVLLVINTIVFARSQKQAAPYTQDPEKEVQKSTANKPVSNTAQQPADTVPKQVGPIENKVTADSHQEHDGAQTIKEINDSLLVMFTGALAVVGYLQYRALRDHEKWMRRNIAISKSAADAATKSANVAESALKLSERADVLLNAAMFKHGTILSGKDARVVLEFKNFGRTRANNLKYTFNLIIEGVPPTDSSKVPQVTMGAGETQHISSQRLVEFLAEDTAQGIFQDKIPLKFEAEVVYKDVFGDPHRSYYEGTLDCATYTFRVDKQDAD
jgi:hypothetical protein